MKSEKEKEIDKAVNKEQAKSNKFKKVFNTVITATGIGHYINDRDARKQYKELNYRLERTKRELNEIKERAKKTLTNDNED